MRLLHGRKVIKPLALAGSDRTDISLILSLAGSDWASGNDFVYVLSLGYLPVIATSSLRLVNVENRAKIIFTGYDG